MCAECHSTHFKRNYNPTKNKYSSSWAEINVSCEACHGPGQKHLTEAQQGKWTEDKGLLVSLSEADDHTWNFGKERSIAKQNSIRTSNEQVEACAQCHSRRAPLLEEHKYGVPLLDTHEPSLALPPLYRENGSIKEEVYIYGSFLQSKMYQQGVTCTNCHNPHSLQLKKRGNDLCFQCHLNTRYEKEKHFPSSSKDTTCVDCHMPSKTYMGIDVRHDHSFKIPKKDPHTLSEDNLLQLSQAILNNSNPPWRE